MHGHVRRPVARVLFALVPVIGTAFAVLSVPPASAAVALHPVAKSTMSHGRASLAVEKRSRPAQAISTSPQLVPSMSRADSDTYLLPSGDHRTTFYAGPVNYLTANGSYQPIVDTLVPAASVGYAYTEEANSYRLDLPANLSSTPVRVAAGATSVSFSLEGASGTPTASGDNATYATALTDTDLDYTAAPDGVEESLVLETASAPHSFSFSVAASGGEELEAQAGGAVAIASSATAQGAAFLAPNAIDADGQSGPVSTSLASTASGWTLTYTLTSTWAASATYPVTLDPTWTYENDGCAISSAQTSSTCSATTYKLGQTTTGTGRGLITFGTLHGTVIPYDGLILTADLTVHLKSDTASASRSVSVYALGHAFTTTATWTTWNGRTDWTTAGGSFTPTSAYTQPAVGPSTGTVHFYPTAMVQSWVNESVPDHGVALKETTEGSSGMLSFTSATASDATDRPRLTVEWTTYGGVSSSFATWSHSIGDQASLSVNMGTGALLVSQKALTIQAPGQPISVTNYYNSAEEYFPSDLGYGWSATDGADVLIEPTAGAVSLETAGETTQVFTQTTPTTYAAPPGITAKLHRTGTHTWTSLSASRTRSGTSRTPWTRQRTATSPRRRHATARAPATPTQEPSPTSPSWHRSPTRRGPRW